MDIFDTHAHLLDEHFDEDREALIASLSDAGVKLTGGATRVFEGSFEY